MIRLPFRIFVATTPVDLRMSFDRLAGIVRADLGEDPRGDAVFVFHNRPRTHAKLLWHDGRGYCLFYKRLDRGAFRIPSAVPAGARHVIVPAHELMLILRGIDAELIEQARRSVARR